MMVYDGRSVSDGCQMVYDGVVWLYRVIQVDVINKNII